MSSQLLEKNISTLKYFPLAYRKKACYNAYNLMIEVSSMKSILTNAAYFYFYFIYTSR